MKNKKIEWKKSSINYDELNKLSHAKLVQIENGTIRGNKNVEEGIVNKAGKSAAIVNLKNGQLERIRNLEQTKKAQYEVGKLIGKRNVINGHLDKIRQKGGLAAYQSNLKSGVFKSFREKGVEANKKPIIAIRISDNKKIKFDSIAEAARVLKLQSCNIVKFLKGKGKRVGNYIFKYK